MQHLHHVKKKEEEASLPFLFGNAERVSSTVKHHFYICLTIIIQNLSKCYKLPFISLKQATTKKRLVSCGTVAAIVCVCVCVCETISV